MKFVDGNGNEITDLTQLEPWEHSVLFSHGVAAPIVKIEYGFKGFSVEWTTDPDFEWRV